MKSDRFIFALVAIVVFAAAGAGIFYFFSKFIDFSNAWGIETVAQKSIAAKQAGGAVVFNPPLPLDAPADIEDAAFSYKNMPKGNPDLTAEDALDAAAFVTARPRPRFIPKK
ncbi:MAG: hypothetical protein M1510_03040 [Nitrospirae bacterium]|nr:hypothetical protein [Nitrospirota bacterium]